jgi:hypothetical protein
MFLGASKGEIYGESFEAPTEASIAALAAAAGI